jgi:hypothetical protein
VGLKRRSVAALIALPLLLAAAVLVTRPRRPVPPLTLAALREASYHCEAVELGRVRLKDGVKEVGGETPVTVRLLDAVAIGDLDGDGATDAAAVLVVSPGGSGTFFHLAPVLNRGGRPVNDVTAFLGDRVQLLGVAINPGAIVVDLVTQGPGDPQCCPTRREERRYRFADGRLLAPETVSPPPPAR